MDCASCGRANRAGAKFCGGCGRPLAPRCPACGSETQPGSQFCDACGASLVAPQAEAAETRKVVTIVFADLIGSTALHERLDAESARRFMERYYRAMRTAVEAHGGTVTQLLGDGVKAVFGVPRVAEDDAIRAVRAAVEMQRAFRELADEQIAAVGQIGLRVAVNTGEVVANDETEIIGDPVNVAARLQAEARDGGVVIGEATRRLVSELVTLAPLGSFALKGRSEAVAAYRVVSLDRPAGAAAIAFVGREKELARITAVFDAAITAPAARLAVLLGSPGLGKSRLIDEFTRRLGDGASVLLAHCDAAGGATFAPLAEALRGLLRIDAGSTGDALRAESESALPGDEPERARIASGVAALLAGTPASPEEIFFVVRRLLTAFAGVRPVVLAIDDIQWAEPLLLDLIEHLVQWGSGVRLLVLAAARPELRDTRSSLATPGSLVSDVVTLAGLDAGAATRLAANVIGAADLPAAVAAKVLATSEGNPLFVAELVRMLVHDGALKRDGDRWTAGVQLAGIEMPPTIQALLAARIERLRPEERMVLERAAVVGRQFSRPAVAQLLPREITDIDAKLESLRRSELIEPDTGWFLGEPVLRFHHVLIRDAAYRRLLKNTRAELHGRFADWLETRAAGAVEHDETLGWHLEQAHQHLCELGPIDAQGRAVGDRAANHLAAAGRRALARDDVPLAASLLGRALERLDAADPARADLALDWCEALLSAGDVGAATKAIDELGRFIGDSDRLRAWHTCFAGQLAALTNPQALRATADLVAGAAESLTAAGDAAGEAKAHSVHALALARLGKVGACEAALDRALAAARRAHDRRRANAVLAGAPLAALWGPSPVTRASGRCLDVVRVLRITQGAPAVEAVALSCQGVLEALRGRTDAARRMIESSRQMVEELGITHRLLDVNVFAGRIELLEGNAVAAERRLRSAYDGLRDLGLGIDAARAAALLARALLALDRVADAEALSFDSEALAGDDLQAAIAWRGVRAEALARRGEHAAAVEFARAAVEIAAATDALLDHADARLALAAALRAAGRSAEADAEEARAIELWEAKGATLLAERARRSDGRTAQVDRAPADRAEPARPIRRRVRANAATAHAAREDAAFAARDGDALPALYADEVEVVDHHAAHDKPEYLASLRRILRARDLTRRHEPLASLGDALALCRMSLSAGGIARGNFDVGPYEYEGIVFYEVAAPGRCRRAEFFASDHLDGAIARLYERYADLLPDGPARTRAAATARSVAAHMGPHDVARYATAIGPAIEFVDHRTMGFESVRGADGMLRVLRSIGEVAHDVGNRVDDVLELRSDAYLLRWTNFGTDRASGGAFERHFLLLWVFGTDGLVTRWELFDADREAEALARFDELATDSRVRSAIDPSRSAKPRERRVRANAATANVARLDAAIAARDGDALTSLIADEMEVVYHYLAGGDFGSQGALASLRSLLSAETPKCRHEPLATLGDSLVLCRQSMSASGFSGRTFDVGAYEYELFALVEVDSNGRQRWAEFFATDHLGGAVARLYERYAGLLPDGPARTRAAATARSVAAMLAQRPELDGWTSAFAPDIEHIDHRTIGFGGVLGGHEFRVALATLFELADDVATRIDDITELRSDALLLHWMNSGTQRASGGAYERPFLWLALSGADGFLTRIELFDPDREAEALARFDELTAGAKAGPRRVRANAATANAARLEAAIAARDADALPALLADGMLVVHHPTGADHGREGVLSSLRNLVSDRNQFRNEPLATLGDSLALCHWSVSGSGSTWLPDVGAYEKDHVVLFEVDAQGRRAQTELFAVDRLGDAIARLYERFAELLPDGPERARAAATARSAAACMGPIDSDRYAPAFAPGIEVVDHRILGTMSTRGADELLLNARSWQLLADNAALREDDILSLQPDALLVRRTHSGTFRASGGVYERQLLQLWVFGSDGLLTRLEYFDADRDAEALARFDELVAEPQQVRSATPPSRAAERIERRVFANAAMANAARMDSAIAARDAETSRALLADDFEAVDHSTGTTWDAQGLLAGWRFLMSARDPTIRREPLATLGDSLALSRLSVAASGYSGRMFDVGAYEREEISLIEVNAQGRRRRFEGFASERLGDAVARLYQRYAELLPAGPERARAAATARSVAAMAGPFDPDRYATAMAPSLEFVDHRTVVGIGSVHGAAALLAWLRTLSEIAADVITRLDDVLGLRSDAALIRRTTSGSDRAGGGAFERQLLQICVFGTDGLITREEHFDADRHVEALARFDELTAGAKAAPRRVRANAATANAARIDAAIAAGDADALLAPFGDEYEVVDHTTGVTYDRQGELFSYRALLSARDPIYRHEPLATLGDSLALFRVSMSASRFAGGTLDVGAYEREQIHFAEVDAQGHGRRAEAFAVDRLGDAIARLYERYAELLPDGPERARAAATARSAAAYLGPLDPDRYAAALAPTIEVVDHRILGTWSARGADEVLLNYRSWLLLSDDAAMRQDDILSLQPDGLLGRRTFFGTDRAGGGAFERQFLQLWVFGSDGLLTRLEYFDTDRDAEALARFDELAAARATPRIENAATRWGDQVGAAWAALEWERFAALFPAGFRMVDRRAMLQLEVDRDQYLEAFRPYFGMTSSPPTLEWIATRGNRLAMTRICWQGTDGTIGPSEVESLNLVELDEGGVPVVLITFDPDDLDAAYAEFDARYAAGEAAPYASTLEAMQRILRGVAAPDWEQSTAVFTEDFVVEDHRLLGWGTSARDEVLAQVRALFDLAPDVTLRVDHQLAVNHRGVLTAVRWVGSRDGGAFEIPFILVTLLGPDGRIRRIHAYDLDQLDEARACFDALTNERPALRIENAATRAADRVGAAWEARDWKRMVELFPAGFRQIDRRAVVQLELDRDQFLEWMRTTFEMSSSRLEQQVLATRGDRLALSRDRLEVADHDLGPSEIEYLSIIEVDEHGERVATVRFDPDDLDAAYAELDQRYVAGEAAPFSCPWETMQRMSRAIAARDWEQLASICTEDFVFEDHSLLGWGTRSRDELVAQARVMVDLAPDAMVRNDHVLSINHRGGLSVSQWVGSRDGGAFEIPGVAVVLLDPDGRVRRIHNYDLEQLDEARARFAALRPDPLRIPPNAATRANDRLLEVLETRDWDVFRARCAPAFVYDDRRRSVLLTGDRDMFISTARFIASQGSSITRTLLATAGDRLSLERFLWTGAADAPDAEIESLVVTEVDAEGRVVAHINFDPGDRHAASAEMFERYVQSGADGMPRGMIEYLRGRNDHDLVRARSALCDDFILDDHRRVGLGRLEGGDAYIASLAALYELTRDVRVDVLYVVAVAKHGRVVVARAAGTNSEGGEFESLYAALVQVRGERIAGIESFELEDLAAALARFEELRPDLARIPPNAATRASDRITEALPARDWDALRALVCDEFRYEDRTRWGLVSGDVEVWIASVTFLVSESGARAKHELLGTVGDRIALHHTAWRSASDGTRFELDRLRIAEVDAEGKLRAMILFDVDDRSAVSAEAQARFAAGEAAAIGGQAPIAALIRAIGRHDWEALGAALAPDAAICDRRALAIMGEVDGEQWIDSLRTLADLAPDMDWELLRVLAWNCHGRVSAGRLFGSTRDGGPFENAFVAVLLTRGDQVQRYEFFDVADAERALARFEELCAP